ncbi:MAG: hypothetical protein K5673_05710 [Lachnospiraceae bacterium]|nr:hypothetical protein [Lachnospiraceae bacterium]
MIERPPELTATSEFEEKKVLNNPLVNREAKRRKAEGGFDAEFEYYEQMVGTSTHEIIDQAEKNWVSGEMDKLVRRRNVRNANGSLSRITFT